MDPVRGEHAGHADEARVAGNTLQDFIEAQSLQQPSFPVGRRPQGGFADAVDHNDVMARLFKERRHVGQAEGRHQERGIGDGADDVGWADQADLHGESIYQYTLIRRFFSNDP